MSADSTGAAVPASGRGIVGIAGYVPYRRLERSAVSGFLGSGGGKGTRAVAGHDEDTTTMGVAAARFALGALGAGAAAGVGRLTFATSTPAYADKTNASAIHAALRLDSSAAAYDAGGALRSGVGALASALEGGPVHLVVAADLRDGLPGSGDESAGGDGAAAVLVAEGSPERPVLAELLGWASTTDEFVDRWRAPGERRSRTWEERFGETRYVPLGAAAFEAALKRAGIDAGSVTAAAVTGMHARAAKAVAKGLGVNEAAVADDLTGSVGQTGTAHPLLVLAAMVERAAPGDVLAVVHLADGADAIVLRVTEARASWRPTRRVDDQVAAGAPLPYAKFLAWRSMLTPEPPRRPEPQRVSSSAAWRSEDWKYGFVGSEDRESHAVHLPPSRVSMRGGNVDDMVPIDMRDAIGTIATYTIDRLAYSPSPPIVFAVLDFDGGGRYPVELTDVDPDTVDIGDRVEMTFRRLNSADGIHNYFWKATPLKPADATAQGSE